uniref:F-box domain-containing protein n=1 Tax=Tanacetum cinerariifolium TaxID=118510 RepID=A0A699ICR1_TANCI|nr:hypothetical protein [Tanacetum cinerariifolium]
MSDNIPFEIQVEIIKRLTVKSLIQFRSVSKLWKSLIDSSAFIADYQRTDLQQHILVRDGLLLIIISIKRETTPTRLVDVLKLSCGVWKSLSVNLPGRTIVTLNTERVPIDKFIYFYAWDRSSRSYLILSFDMISEEFTEIRLPVDEPEYGIWMMENGDPCVNYVNYEEVEYELWVYDPNSEHINYITVELQSVAVWRLKLMKI